MAAALLFALAMAQFSPAPAQPAVEDLSAPALYDQFGRWHPELAYVTAGQDEPGYRIWVVADPQRAIYVRAFNDYLVNYGVGGVVPTWQLIRTASDWQKCGHQPFEVPPTEHWPNIVAALRFIGAFVEPAIGQVEPVSAFRNADLNRCAKGAATSTHLTGGAIDMVPMSPMPREELMRRLCIVELKDGVWNQIGLGIYKGVRFHIDARKTREWGTEGKAGGSGCEAVLREGPMPYTPPSPAVPHVVTQMK